MLVAALVVACTGCPATDDTVTLTVFTDFVPEAQFIRAEYQFIPEGGGPVSVSGTLPSASFARGSGLSSATSGPRAFMPGPHVYRVDLIRADGTTAASAAAENSFVGQGAQTVYLTITRSDCERAGRCADDETCLCGDCYPIACRTTVDLDACPGAYCARSGGCPTPTADCAEAVCFDDDATPEEGRCAWVPVAGVCEDDEWCDGTVGCLSLSGSADAGTRDAGLSDGGSTDGGAMDGGPPRDAAPADAGFTGRVDAGCPGGCDDGDACNGTELCERGECRPGTPMRCDDLVGCTDDSCAAGRCVHTPRDSRCTAMPGGRCDVASDCQYPTCTAATCTPTPGACQDARCVGAMCVRTSLCTASQECCGGACVACDDGNACTTDACAGACTHIARTGASCDDGNRCTTTDRCDARSSCVGVVVTCNDGNACTTDACVPATGACGSTPVPNGTSCSDGSACTTGDACNSGICTGTPVVCNDGNDCTTDTCGASGACMFPAVTNGTTCTLPNATAACMSGTCLVTACDTTSPGIFGDCTSAPGCETDLSTRFHCGACGVPCGTGEECGSAGRCTCNDVSIPGSFGMGAFCGILSPQTVANSCVPATGCACVAGRGNCDASWTNGCETNILTSTAHCGGCNQPCTSGQACTSCGCAPTSESVCTLASGDEDCDGMQNCNDPDCEGDVCNVMLGRTCVGGACL